MKKHSLFWLFALLLLAYFASSTPAQEPGAGAKSAPSSEEEKIKALEIELAKPVTQNYGLGADFSLQEVLVLISDRYGVKIEVNTKDLEAIGVKDMGQKKVAVPQAYGIPLRTLLSILFSQIKGNDGHKVTLALHADHLEVTTTKKTGFSIWERWDREEAFLVPEELEELLRNSRFDLTKDRMGEIGPGTPLKNALEFFSDRIDSLGFVIHYGAFQDAGLPNIETMPIHMPRMPDVNMETVLQLLLAQVANAGYHADYQVRRYNIEIIPRKTTDEDIRRYKDMLVDPTSYVVERRGSTLPTWIPLFIGEETRHYPKREAAYTILQNWGVDVPPPVIEDVPWNMTGLLIHLGIDGALVLASVCYFTRRRSRLRRERLGKN